jgi:hypothetical protein
LVLIEELPMEPELPIWIPIFQALATPAIAIGAVVIAGLQWYLSRERLRLDLFDRRYDVYSKAKEFIAAAYRSDDITYGRVQEFRIAISDAELLFDTDLANYLDEIWKLGWKAAGLYAGKDKLDFGPKDIDDYNHLVDRIGDELGPKTSRRFLKKFKRFLSIRRI